MAARSAALVAAAEQQGTGEGRGGGGAGRTQHRVRGNGGGDCRGKNLFRDGRHSAIVGRGGRDPSYLAVYVWYDLIILQGSSRCDYVRAACSLIIAGLSMMPAWARATVVFDTIGPRSDGLTGPAGALFSPASRLAFPFTASEGGGITSVEAVLGLNGPGFEVPTNLRWEVWTRGTQQGPPLALLGTFPATSLPIIPVTSSTPWLFSTLSPADGSIQLEAGHLYALAIVRDGGASILWWSNGQGAQPFTMPYATGIWAVPGVYQQAQLRISVPAAPVGWVIAMGSAAIFRRRRRGGLEAAPVPADG